jgi:ATP/maltotriose-dependent transcriptional regulator MalT
VGGDSDDYVRYSREAIRLAERTEEQGLQIAERAYMGFASTFAGRLVEGLESCETACRTLPADPALGVEFTGYSPFLAILMAKAWLLLLLGRLEESTVVWDRAERLAREYGDIEVRTWMQIPRVAVDVLRGHMDAARGRASAALETGAKCTTPQSLWTGPFLMGIVHRVDGAWDDSISRLEEALGLATSGGNRMFEGWVRAELALALLGRGELDRAE